MLWDLIQQVLISQAQSKADDANAAAVDVQQTTRLLQTRIQSVEENVVRLSLASMAIAEILCDRFGITQVELEAKVREIDLRDGKLDGRARGEMNDCPSCHHANSVNRSKCLYCGVQLADGSGAPALSPREETHDD